MLDNVTLNIRNLIEMYILMYVILYKLVLMVYFLEFLCYLKIVGGNFLNSQTGFNANQTLIYFTELYWTVPIVEK